MNNGQRGSRASGELTTLMQVMQLNPSCWNQHSVETILDDLEVLAAPEIPETVLFRTQRVQRELILPLVDIVATQSKTITVERRRFSEREKIFKTALASLEAEKSKAIQLYQEEAARLAKHSQFCDMLLGDLDEMAKTLDKTRLDKKQAEGKLVELEEEKEHAEKRLAQLEAEVQRLTFEQEELIQKLATHEPLGDAPKLCVDLQTDTDVKLESRQVTLAASENGTESSSHAADEEGHPKASCATAEEATRTASGLDDYNTSGKTENSMHGASRADQETPGIAAPPTADEAVSSLDVDKTSTDTYMLSSSEFQPHEYYYMESPYEKVSVLEQVAIVVLEEGTTSIQIILDSGLTSAPHAIQHFCKSLCTRTVIGISTAILSVVKHSPLGFAFQMY